MKKLFLLTMLLILGCSGKDIYLDSRDTAFKESYHGYSALKKYKVSKLVEIKNLKIYITSEDLGTVKDGRKILGLADCDNGNCIIMVEGTLLDGKVVTNEVVLGHELLHVLNFHDQTICDPHKPPLRDYR